MIIKHTNHDLDVVLQYASVHSRECVGKLNGVPELICHLFAFSVMEAWHDMELHTCCFEAHPSHNRDVSLPKLLACL